MIDRCSDVIICIGYDDPQDKIVIVEGLMAVKSGITANVLPITCHIVINLPLKTVGANTTANRGFKLYKFINLDLIGTLDEGVDGKGKPDSGSGIQYPMSILVVRL